MPPALLSMRPSVGLCLFLLVFSFPFVCKYLETTCFQCLCALRPAVTILNSAWIWVGCESRSTLTRVPNCSELGTQDLGSCAAPSDLGRGQP
jgi:hypothetical protein